MESIEKNEITKENLIEAVGELMSQRHPEFQLKLHSTHKTNGVVKEALSFVEKAGSAMSVAPVIYFEDFLEKVQKDPDYTILDAAEDLMELFENAMSDSISNDIKELFGTVDKTKIVPEIVNMEANREMLLNTPHRIIAEDLAVIARYQVTDQGSTVISNDLATRLMLTPTEVMDAAVSNAKGECKTMCEIMADMMNIPEEQAREMLGDNGMYIVSNEKRVYGAAPIYLDRNLRKEVAEVIGGDFYILPSSIHECICISADRLTPDEANDMITEVNAGELLPEEILSDHCYHVNSETLKISNPMKESLKEKPVAKAVSAM